MNIVNIDIRLILDLYLIDTRLIFETRNPTTFSNNPYYFNCYYRSNDLKDSQQGFLCIEGLILGLFAKNKIVLRC